MRAFHTLRTKNKSNFALADFEIFTLILSSLEWRKHNGEIFLCTDTTGKNFMANAGLLNLWNGVDTSLDEMDSLGIDENIFWAGAKLYALSKQPLPCVMIDLDFIVWQSLKFDSKLAVIHRESCDLPCYPDENYFRFKNFKVGKREVRFIFSSQSVKGSHCSPTVPTMASVFNEFYKGFNILFGT